MRGFAVVLMTFLLFGLATAPLRAADAPAVPVKAAALQPAPSLQFRDIFRQDMKPNDRAGALHGKRVRLMGFFAPQIIPDLPFAIMTGAPVQRCPYCSEGEDVEQFPFLLIYPREEDVPSYGARSRLIVEGELEVGLEYDETLGQANHMRIRNAEIMSIQELRDFTRPRSNHRNLPAELADPTEIDG